jgi:DNA-binding IscR family transcriptional regulator
MEGLLAALPRASETAFRKCDECLGVETCVTRAIMREVRDAAADILDRSTLVDASRKKNALQGSLRPHGADVLHLRFLPYN